MKPTSIGGWLITLVINAFGSLILSAIKEWLADRAKRAADREAGAAAAEGKTLEEIGRTADAQAESNAMDRGTAADVAGRVRDRYHGLGRGGDTGTTDGQGGGSG